MRIVLRDLFEDEGFTVLEAETGRQALTAITQEQPDIVLMDVRLPELSGIDVLQQLKLRQITSTIVLMTAYGTSHLVIRGTELGAVDYVAKPFDSLDKLLDTVRRHLPVQGVTSTVGEGTGQIERDPRNRIIGSSPRMVEVFKMIGRVASHDVTVLITGETGTGKGLVAGAIHSYSPRRSGPYVQVACAALPETLLESELFGHEKGAFTSALTVRKGRFEMADKGTIFLDEIGEMTLSTQKKLLRVLQDKTIERLGSGVERTIDVRVIAATNRRLEEDIEASRFREDLYYRLNVIAIHMPPLRDRREDISLLVEHFLDRHRFTPDGPPSQMSQDAIALLLEHQWPGNVRELENVIQRAVTLSAGRVIQPEHLRLSPASAQPRVSHPRALPESLALLERKMISEALFLSNGSTMEAARLLNISEAYLQQKLDVYGLRTPVMSEGQRGADS
ncbi:MAG: sigma-54 dependent transcriptional regulator [Chloroflexi bacterium]|nr:sigma-54 dependent transcriptional regulator [Chloroflexota bacterium]